ncbi:MAG: hypothetical protein IMW96_09260 [Thermoanaerobacteraceae bacterium]|uniref:hypothetical protein n=1 Tax=Thermanaeromonas sp. C210 TaxID=2731925 RepID=UPI00155BDF0B|nr:hypothetical protein [Thermanaeromonas sp. C210]MBE3581798.1 hypothetical protein [Thermoanaerobacteraceae bacterium]GFN22759.1 hypothetical protein TAMC210_10760 [Thermanaeromonas sp. C210]
MEPAPDACLRCGASTSLISRILGETPVEVPSKGVLCPTCYQELAPEEYARYFRT